MKCPNCGSEIIENEVYCKDCGYEVNMVPVFEPEIFENLHQTMQDIAGEMEEHTKTQETINKKAHKRRFIIKITLACLFIVVLAFVIVMLISKYKSEHTYDFHYQKALEYAQKEKYSAAISSIEKALEYDNDNSVALLLRALYYKNAGRVNDAVNLYSELLFYEQTKEDACKALAAYYLENEDYNKLNTLLKKYADEELAEVYAEYLVSEPEFSLHSGTYDKTLTFSLEDSIGNSIYFTLDGEIPTIDSELYSDHITLGLGTYTVQAIAVNKYGVQSEVVKCEYIIDVISPEAPVVKTMSGDYATPEYIIVSCEAGCKIYYTTDQSIPSPDNGYYYSGPLAMPFGECSFSFACYNAANIASDVTQLSTNLNISYVVSLEDSLNSLIRYFVDSGKYSTVECLDEVNNGIYSYNCTGAIPVNGMILYFVEENYETEDGVKYKTGDFYGIDAGSGYLFKLIRKDDGYYEEQRL